MKNMPKFTPYSTVKMQCEHNFFQTFIPFIENCVDLDNYSDFCLISSQQHHEIVSTAINSSLPLVVS